MLYACDVSSGRNLGTDWWDLVFDLLAVTLMSIMDPYCVVVRAKLWKDLVGCACRCPSNKPRKYTPLET
jgi:hypothetical protein